MFILLMKMSQFFLCKRNFHLYNFFLFQKREVSFIQRKVKPNTKITLEEIRTKLREVSENNEANVFFS